MTKEQEIEKYKFTFGDYCIVEQKRFGVPNEKYLYKVIGGLDSNSYTDVPVMAVNSKATIHSEIVPILRCVCVGLGEDEVCRFKVEDCTPNIIYRA